MSIIKFLFNGNYRTNIMEMFSAKIIINNYKVDTEMESIYENINASSQSLAA